MLHIELLDTLERGMLIGYAGISTTGRSRKDPSDQQSADSYPNDRKLVYSSKSGTETRYIGNLQDGGYVQKHAQ
jgi:hypothetical protein